jgi:hypothetical protein
MRYKFWTLNFHREARSILPVLFSSVHFANTHRHHKTFCASLSQYQCQREFPGHPKNCWSPFGFTVERHLADCTSTTLAVSTICGSGWVHLSASWSHAICRSDEGHQLCQPRVQQARNIAALGNTSRGDRELWNQFQENPEAVAANAEVAYAALSGRVSVPPAVAGGFLASARRVQAFFRAAVLTSDPPR